MIPSQQGLELDLRGYLKVLRRRWWIIVVGTVVLGALGYLTTARQDPVYEATSAMVLRSQSADPLVPDPLASDQELATELVLLDGDVMRAAVAEALGRPATVTIDADAGSAVVRLTARDSDAQRAADIANTYVDVYIDVRRAERADQLQRSTEEISARLFTIGQDLDDMQRSLDDVDPEAPGAADTVAALNAQRATLESQRATYLSQQRQVEFARTEADDLADVVRSARMPTAPVSPDTKRTTATFAAVGLLLGLAAAFVVDHLDDTITTKDGLEAASGTTVLGLVPGVSSWRRRSDAFAIALASPRSPVSETYRTIRTALQFISLDRPARLIQVTSATAGEGKSSTVANLAVTMAAAGQRVAVVCCDLRRPRIHQFFGLDNSVGIGSVLVGASTLADALQPVPDVPNLSLLASGPTPPNPAELLGHPRTAELFQQLVRTHDVVFVDSPPILPVSDGLILSRAVDTVVLVVSAGTARERDVGRAVELLHQVDAPLVGTILNQAKDGDVFGYGYGYGYGDADDSHGDSALRRRFRVRPGRSRIEARAEPVESSQAARASVHEG